MNMPSIPIVTFYSFKGGSGRTICAANFTSVLAKKLGASQKNPVLLVDMDLDSAGLTIFFKKCSIYEKQRWNAASLVSGDLELGVRQNKIEFFSKGLTDVSAELGLSKGSVRFLGGIITERRNEPEGTTAFNSILYLIDKLKDEKYSAIVVDSASGRQNIALAWHDVSPVMVYCCRLTYQFLYGTEQQVRYALKPNSNSQSPENIIILPTAVPKFQDNSKSHRSYKNAIGWLGGLTSKSGHRKVILHEGVPEVESFKWVERVLTQESNLATDESEALTVFEKLADNVCQLWAQNRSSSHAER